jgi:phage gp36-like protein
MSNFLTAGELKTHLYEDVVNEITRNDDSIIDDAIDTALDEMKGWLSKYDIDNYFATVAPSARNKKLLSICKDISAWYLIHLCNVTIDYDKWRTLYEDATTWLSQVQKGQVVLTLPQAVVPGSTPPTAVSPVKWASNTKRNNHF